MPTRPLKHIPVVVEPPLPSSSVIVDSTCCQCHATLLAAVCCAGASRNTLRTPPQHAHTSSRRQGPASHCSRGSIRGSAFPMTFHTLYTYPPNLLNNFPDACFCMSVLRAHACRAHSCPWQHRNDTHSAHACPAHLVVAVKALSRFPAVARPLIRIPGFAGFLDVASPPACACVHAREVAPRHSARRCRSSQLQLAVRRHGLATRASTHGSAQDVQSAPVRSLPTRAVKIIKPPSRPSLPQQPRARSGK